MLSHWSPTYYAETQKRPESTPTMIAHCAKHPLPGSILNSMEEVGEKLNDDADRADFKEWFADFREQLKADRTKFIADLRKDFSLFKLS